MFTHVRGFWSLMTIVLSATHHDKRSSLDLLSLLRLPLGPLGPKGQVMFPFELLNRQSHRFRPFLIIHPHQLALVV